MTTSYNTNRLTAIYSNNNHMTTTTQISAANNSKNEDSDYCTYCQRSIGNIYIKCCECIQFYMCLKCFSMSAEMGDHRKDHNYFIISRTNFPLFDSESLWTSKEELILIQFIEQYGFGNWEEIAKHLPGRSAEDCRQHYNSYYIYGNLGKYTFNSIARAYLLNNQKAAATIASVESSSETNSSILLPPIEMSLEQQRALGYMPLRDDFEREYKNESEHLLSNLTIGNHQLVLLNQNCAMPFISNSSQYVNGGGGVGNGISNHMQDLRLGCNSSSVSNLFLSPNAAAANGSSSSAANNFINNFNNYVNHHGGGVNGGTTPHSLTSSPSPLNAANSSSIISNNKLDQDEVVDFELKLALIRIYRDHLIERQRLKNLAREYGLINCASSLINKHADAVKIGAYGLTDPKYVNSNNKLQKRHGRLNSVGLNNVNKMRKNATAVKNHQMIKLDEFNEKFKRFAQFMSVTDYELLMECLRKHRAIENRLSKLQFYHKKMGFTKLREIEHHECDKAASASATIHSPPFKKRWSKSPNKKTMMSNNDLMMDECWKDDDSAFIETVRKQRKKRFSYAAPSPIRTPTKRFKRDISPTTYKLSDSYLSSSNNKQLNHHPSQPTIKIEESSSLHHHHNVLLATSRSTSLAKSRSKSSSRNSATSSTAEEEELSSSNQQCEESSSSFSSDSKSNSESSSSSLYKIANRQKLASYVEEASRQSSEATIEKESSSNSDETASHVSSSKSDNLSTTETVTTNSNMTSTRNDDYDENDSSSISTSSTTGIASRLRGSSSKLNSKQHSTQQKQKQYRASRSKTKKSNTNSSGNNNKNINNYNKRKFRRVVCNEDDDEDKDEDNDEDNDDNDEDNDDENSKSDSSQCNGVDDLNDEDENNEEESEKSELSSSDEGTIKNDDDKSDDEDDGDESNGSEVQNSETEEEDYEDNSDEDNDEVDSTVDQDDEDNTSRSDSNRTAQRRVASKQTVKNGKSSSMSKKSSKNNSGTRRGRVIKLRRAGRLCSMPGYNLLSESEKKLVSSLNMKPTDFISIKGVLGKYSQARRQHNINQLNLNTSILGTTQQKHQMTTNTASPSSCLSAATTNGYKNSTTFNFMTLRRYNSSNSTSPSLINHHSHRHEENNHQINGGDSMHHVAFSSSILTATSDIHNNRNGAVSNSLLLNGGANGLVNDHKLSSSLQGNNHNFSATLSSASVSTTNLRNDLASIYDMKDKMMLLYMKSSCPNYFKLARSARKRLVRFLGDTGCLDSSIEFS